MITKTQKDNAIKYLNTLKMHVIKLVTLKTIGNAEIDSGSASTGDPNAAGGTTATPGTGTTGGSTTPGTGAETTAPAGPTISSIWVSTSITETCGKIDALIQKIRTEIQGNI